MDGEDRQRRSPADPSRWRCFLAVDLSADVRGRLSATVAELRQTEADVRWVRDGALHLTLAFLGSVEIERLAAIEAALRAELGGLAPIDLEVRGLGAFPGLRRAAVLWAGVRGDGLAELAAAVGGALERLGFAADRRPFRAHVTIGRVRSRRGWGRLEGLLRGAEDREFGACKARGVSAYRSDLRPDGAVYTKLWTVEMGVRDGDSD